MESLLQDIRYGIRSLLKSRRFTLAAVLTLGLGIGANTAMFSVIHSVLLKPWPFKDPARVLAVSQRQANGNLNLFSTQDFLDWKQQGGILGRMGAHVSWEFNLSGTEDHPERIPGGQVSYDMLPVLGVQPMLGRLFSAQEDVAGSGNFVVLSYPLWKNRYRANPRIAGTAIQLDGVPYTVVGVMPAGFDVLGGNELLWTPLQLRRNSGIGSSSNFHWLGASVRLPDGVSLKQAQAELDSIAVRLHREDATGDAGFGVDLKTFNDALTSDVRPALLMLMGCVGCVLLIACSNVANLLLARGTARRREMAIRTALGASPLRVARQLLTESVLLASMGGMLGVAFAFLALRGMLAIHPPSIPRMEEVNIDGGVLVFSLLVSVLVGILFGTAPAIEAAQRRCERRPERAEKRRPLGTWHAPFRAGDLRNRPGLPFVDWYRACTQEPLVAARRGTGVCSQERADVSDCCACAIHRAADNRLLPASGRTDPGRARGAIGSSGSQPADEWHGSFHAHSRARKESGPHTRGDCYPLSGGGGGLL